MDTDHPKTIGRYQVERLLGAGAMGFVFLATDPELDRLVAIKTLRDLTLDESALQIFLERFRNEARAAARLHHPAIVQVYDVGDDPEVGPFSCSSTSLAQPCDNSFARGVTFPRTMSCCLRRRSAKPSMRPTATM